MPTSLYNQLNTIVEAIYTVDPKAILDVGVGFGKYGVLAREYLDAGDLRNNSYRSWKRRIDGIEAFAEYITPLHDFVYDHVYVGDARDIVRTLEPIYDLVLFIDVIEHFVEDEGRQMLADLLRVSRNVLVSTPKMFIEQPDLWNNPFEIHKSLWTPAHFRAFGKPVCFLPHDISWICVIGEDAPRVARALRGWKIWVKTWFPFVTPPYRAMKSLFQPKKLPPGTN